MKLNKNSARLTPGEAWWAVNYHGLPKVYRNTIERVLEICLNTEVGPIPAELEIEKAAAQMVFLEDMDNRLEDEDGNTWHPIVLKADTNIVQALHDCAIADRESTLEKSQYVSTKIEGGEDLAKYETLKQGQLSYIRAGLDAYTDTLLMLNDTVATTTTWLE